MHIHYIIMVNEGKVNIWRKTDTQKKKKSESKMAMLLFMDGCTNLGDGVADDEVKDQGTKIEHTISLVLSFICVR
jgi:hypothetical protein